MVNVDAIWDESGKFEEWGERRVDGCASVDAVLSCPYDVRPLFFRTPSEMPVPLQAALTPHLLPNLPNQPTTHLFDNKLGSFSILLGDLLLLDGGGEFFTEPESQIGLFSEDMDRDVSQRSRHMGLKRGVESVQFVVRIAETDSRC